MYNYFICLCTRGSTKSVLSEKSQREKYKKPALQSVKRVINQNSKKPGVAAAIAITVEARRQRQARGVFKASPEVAGSPSSKFKEINLGPKKLAYY